MFRFPAWRQVLACRRRAITDLMPDVDNSAFETVEEELHVRISGVLILQPSAGGGGIISDALQLILKVHDRALCPA